MSNPEKTPEAPKAAEQKKEEEVREKEISPERVEVEEGVKPWERLILEQEANLTEEYQEKSKLSQGTKEAVDLTFRQEIDEKQCDFAKKWFKEHQEELAEKGVPLKISDEKKVEMAIQQGALRELKSEEEYGEQYKEIENLAVVRTDFGKEVIPLESLNLALNSLQKRTERIEKELGEAERKRDRTAVSIKRQELENLFKTRQELAEKISGRDLRREADGKAEFLAEKKEYVNEAVEGGLGKKTSIEERREALGYGIEKKGLLRKRFEVRDGEGKIHKFQKEKDLDAFLEEQLTKELTEDFGKEWEGKNQEREKQIRGLVEKEIKGLASAPEKAEGGIETVYSRVKDRLVTEFAEKDLKKGKKSREELKRIEQEFKGEGKNPFELIDNVLHRKGGLEDLTGNWEKDKEGIEEFLDGWGVSVDPEKLKGFLETKGKGSQSYEKMVKKQKGFLEWLIELTSFLSTPSKEERKRKQKR